MGNSHIGRASPGGDKIAVYGDVSKGFSKFYHDPTDAAVANQQV